MVRTSTRRQGTAPGPSRALRAGGLIALVLALHLPAVADECPLAAPGRMITAPSQSVAAHAFEMPNARETRETVVLRSGAKLQLSLSGCEYVELAVRFEAKGPRLTATNTRGAFRLAADALAALASTKVSTVFDLKVSEQALRRAAAAKATPVANEEIQIPDGMEPPARVTVERWGTDAKGFRFVELRLVWGPA